ncbi:hypothetical protein CcI156_01120 [Frankia sp. CcI156]|uniref:Integral membrane protein n=1 Tax=Frankia casuarinae (strain DSM 45818 / CECT 9043 / HFP020203 / CcI3) TaxID=106370 RepID=Q2JFW0_FRACC|nr:putative integral membrane protein [Frankia casuarinae]OFB41466.1 hypothetical protein Manayef4_02510 [Frankia sp. CgIM4]OHV50862.1 hypothetical protein CgIS1_04265 [Frankia sp. CgIS1]ONH30109.1 hypothetical protein CcI156_01120 [Frankia sp. CcI156]ORT53228.1 hypothetical protein KBI5_07810 [Frankia sp. KB5]
MAALVATGLVMAAAALGTGALAAVLIVEQIAFAWAWVRILRASTGTTLLVAAWGVLGDVVLLASDRPSYGSLAGVVGIAVAVMILYQLARRRSAPVSGAGSVSANGSSPVSANGSSPPPGPAVRVGADLAAALSGIIFCALFAGYLALRVGSGAHHPADLLVIAGLLGAGGTVVAGRLVGWAGVPVVPAGAVGVLVGAALGAGFGALDPDRLAVGAAVAIAAAGAAVAAVIDLVLARARDAEPRVGPVATSALVADVLLTAILPLASAAPLVYFVGRHLPA